MSGPLLLVDWGSTSRRAWLLDGHGSVVASCQDDRGVLGMARDSWGAAFAELKQRLGAAEPRLSLLAGMAGADRGWREAGYVPCPATLEDLAGALCWVEPGRIGIVPGLSYSDGTSADVMRGEETQLLGAVAAGLAPADCLACLPGTHTKWALVRNARVTAFRTVITGELFALLRNNSMLGDRLRDEVVAGPDFDAGVERGVAGADLTAELFAVRAHALLATGRVGNGAAFASGLLIGADLRAGLRMNESREVHVIGRSDLAALYVAALEQHGCSAVAVDGGAAALAGLTRLAELAE